MGAATTIFLWMRVSSAHEKFKSAIIISGLVTFIAAYHYMRIFNSWVEAYEWQKDGSVLATTSPFNDAYRYMDWLLTVPLLLIEIILVMKLPADESKSKATTLGVASAVMIPFCYIVQTLLVGLSDATNSESDAHVRGLVKGDAIQVYIQLGSSVSDIISKCGIGLMIYQISMAKTHAMKNGSSEETALL